MLSTKLDPLKYTSKPQNLYTVKSLRWKYFVVRYLYIAVYQHGARKTKRTIQKESEQINNLHISKHYFLTKHRE